NGVSDKQTLAVNVSSTGQAPAAAAGCSGCLPQAARPFFQAPGPQATRRSVPLTRLTSVTAPSFPVSSVIDSSLPSLAGNTYFLPATFAGVPLPSGTRSDRPFRVLASLLRDPSSGGSGDGLNAGRSLSQTRFNTACMSRTPAVMATTASC